MDLTLQSLTETRKQSLQLWVTIDFSGITCISKGFQGMTCCPISSKTRCTWLWAPLSSEGCGLPSCYISYVFIPAYLFHVGFFCWRTVSSFCQEPQSSFHLEQFFFYCIFKCHSGLWANPCFYIFFFLWFCFPRQKPRFGLGRFSHCIFLIPYYVLELSRANWEWGIVVLCTTSRVIES